MKIASVDAHWLHVPIPPEGQHVSDFGRSTSFDAVLVRIETDSGLVGHGEAKSHVGSDSDNQALVTLIGDELGPKLIGQDARDNRIKVLIAGGGGSTANSIYVFGTGDEGVEGIDDFDGATFGLRLLGADA